MDQVSRATILKRAVSGACPRCEKKTIFRTRFRLNSHCTHCQLPIADEDGWSLGAIPLNYAITCVFWVLPLAVLFITGVVSIKATLIMAGAGCLVVPVMTYRFSKKLWLGIYYAILPDELNVDK